MKGDLAVLVADKDMQLAIEALLCRHQAMRVRRLTGVRVVSYSGHDSGVRARGSQFLTSSFQRSHSHGLLVLDLHGSGYSGTAEQLESILDRELKSHWGDCARSLVIDPELENWAWTSSSRLGPSMGFSSTRELREWLESQGLWLAPATKPSDPKRAMLAALEHNRLPRSASRFADLAEKVSFKGCQDRAFLRLLDTLRAWFPPARSVDC